MPVMLTPTNAYPVPVESAPRRKQTLVVPQEQQKLFFDYDNTPRAPAGYMADTFLGEYAANINTDFASIRIAILNKLLAIADCGDTKFELRALELLGKHSDVGLFTERTEVTVNNKSPEDLEKAIRDRVRRLMDVDMVNITPRKSETDGKKH